MKETKLISIPSLCELYGKDPSQLNKMIDKLGITKQKVRRKKDNKIVNVITEKEHLFLKESYDNLTAAKASRYFISFAEASTALGYTSDQLSNFKRTCIRFQFKIYKKKFDGRTQSCITQSDFKKLLKVKEAITVKDV